MVFNYDIVLLIIAVFMFLTGIYFGFYNQLRRTLSSVAGLVVSLFTCDIVAGIIASLETIVNKITNIFIPGISVFKLLVGLVIFLVVKLVLFLFIGLFKKRGAKAFLKDKNAISGIVGGVLGLVNAYIVGLMLYMLFACFNGVANASVSSKIFTIIPQFKEIIESILNNFVAVE